MMANSWRKTGKGGERGAPELLSGRSKAGALPRPLCGGFAMFIPPAWGAGDPGFAKYAGAPVANFKESLQLTTPAGP